MRERIAPTHVPGTDGVGTRYNPVALSLECHGGADTQRISAWSWRQLAALDLVGRLLGTSHTHPGRRRRNEAPGREEVA